MFTRDKPGRAQQRAGALLTAGGLYSVSQANKGGYLTGRETLYHVTPRSNVESIRSKGILGYNPSAARTRGGLTGNALMGVPEEQLAGKSYAFKKRRHALLHKFIEPPSRGGGTANKKIIRIKAPVGSLKETVNPELRGATSGKELHNILKKRNPFYGIFNTESTSNQLYNLLSNKSTKTVQGDIGSQYIVGSPNYKRNSLSEFKSFVKNNPKKFAIGAGKAALGTAAIAGGLKLMGFKKKEKQSV